jgi:transposase
MRKVYIVNLTEGERAELHALIKKGTTSARKIARAQILLHADEGKTDAQIAVALHVGRATVERIRKRFVEGNLPRALHEDPRPGKAGKLDAKGAAYLIATACSVPPRGRAKWTMQLLADRLVALKIVSAISDETVRRTLKKTNSSPGNGRNGASRR